jgi:hypothetical protein
VGATALAVRTAEASAITLAAAARSDRFETFTNPQLDTASVKIAEHIAKLWDPRMRRGDHHPSRRRIRRHSRRSKRCGRRRRVSPVLRAVKEPISASTMIGWNSHIHL